VDEDSRRGKIAEEDGAEFLLSYVCWNHIVALSHELDGEAGQGQKPHYICLAVDNQGTKRNY
jgi:hypothetical protein